MLDKFTKADFTNLGEPGLLIEHAGLTVPLAVAQLSDVSGNPARAESFSVVLEGPAQPLLAQGMYRFIHPRHGCVEMFMVPIGRDAAHCRYELIFN